MKHTLLSLGLAASLSIGWSASARADVVGPAPSSCPAGASPNSCHGGPFCEPKTCANTCDGAAGEICKQIALCVESIGCGGFVPPDADPSQFERPNAVGACPNGDECTPPAKCQVLQVCALPWEGSGASSSGGGEGATSGGAGESGGCACRMPGVSREIGGAAALGALALAAGLALARRRKG